MMSHIRNYPVNFVDLNVKQIIEIIEEMNSEITFLELPNNDLGNRTYYELQAIFVAIVIKFPNLTAMNLSMNNLGNFTVAEVKAFFEFFSKLPKIKYLDLSNNNLGHFKIDKLQTMMSFLQNLKTLNLSNNKLSEVRELELMFNKDMDGPQNLCLSKNGLGYMREKTLVSLFENFPDAMKVLDLSCNKLTECPWIHCVTVASLIKAIKQLGKNINMIDLRGNFLLEGKMSQLLDHFPDNTKIGLRDGIFEIYQLWVDPIIDKVIQKIFYRIQNEKIAFEEILLPIENIDERILNKYINYLEKYNTGISNLVCGLLLEGRIPNIYPECDDMQAYKEKRLHDAISYYSKAAQDPEYGCVAKEILREIKSTRLIPSIQYRLSQYDLHTASSYCLFNYNGNLKTDIGLGTCRMNYKL